MKIILLKSVVKLGQAGDIKIVADGYALNYLIPRGLAKYATKDALKELKNKKKDSIKTEKSAIKQARRIKNKLEGKTVTVQTKASPEGTLFASIKQKDVVNALKMNLKVTLKESQIIDFPQVKKIGEFPVRIKLSDGIEASVQLNVIAV